MTPRKLFLCELPEWVNDPQEIETWIKRAARMMYVDLNCYNIEIIDGTTRFLLSGRTVYAVPRPVENIMRSL